MDLGLGNVYGVELGLLGNSVGLANPTSKIICADTLLIIDVPAYVHDEDISMISAQIVSFDVGLVSVALSHIFVLFPICFLRPDGCMPHVVACQKFGPNLFFGYEDVFCGAGVFGWLVDLSFLYL